YPHRIPGGPYAATFARFRVIFQRVPSMSTILALPPFAPVEVPMTGANAFNPRGLSAYHRVLVALYVCVLATATGSHNAAAAPIFTSHYLKFDVGQDPSAVAIGDINGDGRPDMAVPNYSRAYPNTSPIVVSLLIGRGDGTFSARADY